MNFWDQLTGSLNKVTKDISSKAQEITDTAKLNSKINDANALVKSTFAAIGEAYYERYKDDESNEFADQFHIVDEAKTSIEEYRNEIMRLKGVVRCVGCGSEVQKDASFCPKCGAKIVHPAEPKMEEEQDEEKPQKEKKYCSVCHTELNEEDQFCTNCGALVGEEAQPKEPEDEE